MWTDHDHSKFQTLPHNFQKQGGDQGFDCPPREEEKLEIRDQEKQIKKKRGWPKKVVVKEKSDKDSDYERPLDSPGWTRPDII